MASSIDPTKPTEGSALTSDVRANFSTAKTEIEALQTDKAALADLASTATVAQGDALIGGKRTDTSAEAYTYHLLAELRPVYVGVDFGAALSLTNGTDDWSTVIQAAIDTGHKVILPEGTLGIGTALSVGNNDNIVGAGRNKTRIKPLTNTINAINFDANARKVVLAHFNLEAPSVGTANYGINADTTTGFAECSIHHVDIHKFKYGIYFEELTWNNKFSNMRFQACDYGIYTADAAGNSINNLYEHLYVEESITGGFRFQACNWATFDTCNFGGAGASPLLQFTSTTRASLINCHFEAVSVSSGNGVVDISGASHVALIGCSWQSNSGVSGTAYELKIQSTAVVTATSCTVQSQGANISDIQIASTAQLHILDNSFTGTISHASGSTATSKIYRNGAPIQAKSSVIDLSGAATDLVIFNTPSGRGGRITRIALIYTEASSADAGIVLTVKNADAVDTYASETTEVSKAKWYVKEVTLSTTVLRESDTIIVSSPGGKTGAGEVQVIVEYALDKV